VDRQQGFAVREMGLRIKLHGSNSTWSQQLRRYAKPGNGVSIRIAEAQALSMSALCEKQTGGF
jgi:hypothetical protein